MQFGVSKCPFAIPTHPTSSVRASPIKVADFKSKTTVFSVKEKQEQLARTLTYSITGATGYEHAILNYLGRIHMFANQLLRISLAQNHYITNLGKTNV